MQNEVRPLQAERPDHQELLQSAQKIVYSGRDRLWELLAEARAAVREYRARQQTTQARLLQVADQLELALRRQSSLDGEARSDTRSQVELFELEEEYQSLRQQQAWLTERLVGYEAAQRRIRDSIRQLERGVGLLKREIESAEQDARGELDPCHARVLQAQEDERRRLAREVHDGPAQVLANAIFELEYCERLLDKDPDRLKKELARLKRDVREGLADVRYFLFGLRPAPLSQLGLSATLLKYAEDYQSRFGIRVELELDEIPRLPSTFEVAIFRIIQEALQNTQKHSGADSVQVRVRMQKDALQVTVTDSGRGFDISRQTDLEAKRFGLTSMRERARLMQGELEVTSQLGVGTAVHLTVPNALLQLDSKALSDQLTGVEGQGAVEDSTDG